MQTRKISTYCIIWEIPSKDIWTKNREALHLLYLHKWILTVRLWNTVGSRMNEGELAPSKNYSHAINHNANFNHA